MAGQESTSASASEAPVPAAVPTEPLQDVYDAYFTDISNNDNLDAYRLYEYKRCIDYIKKNKKSTQLLDKMRETVIKILKQRDRKINLPIDTELKEVLSTITNDLTVKSFLMNYKPDDLMITIKPGNDKFIPIIKKAATDNDFAKQFVLLGTSTDDYEIKIMKVDSDTLSK